MDMEVLNELIEEALAGFLEEQRYLEAIIKAAKKVDQKES